jgi:ATP-binding cassette subfamily B protein
MIAAYYGRNYSLEGLRNKSNITREGVSVLGISEAAEKLGFRTMGVKVPFEDLKEAPTPFVVHWNQSHFIVIYDIKKEKGKEYIYAADPGGGKIKYTKDEFCRCWLSSNIKGRDVGTALLMTPTPDFYALESEKKTKRGFGFLLSYLKPYKGFIQQLIIGLIFGSLLQLIIPFLTQAIVDFGINPTW